VGGGAGGGGGGGGGMLAGSNGVQGFSDALNAKGENNWKTVDRGRIGRYNLI